MRVNLFKCANGHCKVVYYVGYYLNVRCNRFTLESWQDPSRVFRRLNFKLGRGGARSLSASFRAIMLFIDGFTECFVVRAICYDISM